MRYYCMTCVLWRAEHACPPVHILPREHCKLLPAATVVPQQLAVAVRRQLICWHTRQLLHLCSAWGCLCPPITLHVLPHMCHLTGVWCSSLQNGCCGLVRRCLPSWLSALTVHAVCCAILPQKRFEAVCNPRMGALGGHCVARPVRMRIRHGVIGFR
jgi:hypothetical protein